MKQYNNRTIERGVSLYLTIVIMTILLAVSLGLAAILVGQIKLFKGMGDSVVAFYAADTGVERTLYAVRKEGYVPSLDDEPCGGPTPILNCPALSVGATYFVKITGISPVTINSEGDFNNVSRAVEIKY